MVIELRRWVGGRILAAKPSIPRVARDDLSVYFRDISLQGVLFLRRLHSEVVAVVDGETLDVVIYYIGAAHPTVRAHR